MIADLAPRLHEDSNTIVSIVPIPGGFWITNAIRASCQSVGSN